MTLVYEPRHSHQADQGLPVATRPRVRLSPFWRAQIAAWSFIGLFDALNRSLVHQDVMIGVALTLVLDPFGVLLTALMRSLYRRLVPTASITPIALFWVFTLSLIGAWIFTAMLLAVRFVTGWWIPGWSPDQSLGIPFVYSLMIFVAWSLAYFWISAELRARNERQRASEAEAEALRRELQQLRGQLDPHLLFNALNGVAAEMPEAGARAAVMLEELSNYLRRCLDHTAPDVMPLREEVESVRAYLRVQQARFGADLSYEMTVDPLAEDRPVPGFLLQPLVENAVKHGRATAPALHLRIAVTVPASAPGDLDLRVTSRGRLSPDWRSAGSPGVGLTNLKRRLELHYPGRSTFSLRQVGDEVTASLRLTGEPCSV